MFLGLNNLGNKKRKRKLVGRGRGSGRGTYATRGLNGQRKRSGGKGGLKRKGFRKTLLSFPKFKGMKSHYAKNQVVKLADLEKKFENGSQITPGTLLAAHLIKTLEEPVKILALKDSPITKQFNIFSCKLSLSARQALEKAGGKLMDREELGAEEKK